ncbi:MAG TPA: recombinase family protein [Rhizomicrobium sp.]
MRTVAHNPSNERKWDCVILQNVTKIVAYYRVSTAKQGRSGLGLEAQRKAVADYAAFHSAKIEGEEFTEIESGKVKANDRPQLKAAIALAKAKRATLCVAKLDRVGRRAADVLNLLNDSRVKVVFADSPNASQLQIGILAVVAEEEARAISVRTKAALAAAKARGTKLGCPNGGAALARYRVENGNAPGCAGARRSANEFANDTLAFVEPLVIKGLSDSGIAAALNADGIETRRGGRWHETSVRRLRARLAI